MTVNEDAEGSPGPGPKKHRLRQRFDVQKKLGQGTYGKVQLAVNKETGQEVAIKTIKKSKIETEQDLVRIRREIQIMSSIQHPHIIHIYEVFENKDKIVLVMQYASGGELYDYLSDKKVLDDKEARRIFRQIAAAVYYCHKNKICHRDLKLENVLIDDKGNAKLADFGLSNVFDDRHHLNTFCGSPLYASPEIVKGVPYFGPEVDCWSLGVLLFTLVYGSMPFDGTNFKRLVKQISDSKFYEPEEKSGASDLIHWLLQGDPAKRANIEDICADGWVNEGYEHSLLQVAEDLANLTPVRLDLLVALAPVSPSPSAQHLATEDEDTTTDTQAGDSFAYTAGDLVNDTSVEDFLPAELALAELDEELASGGDKRTASLSRVSSTSHEDKKPRTSAGSSGSSLKSSAGSCEERSLPSTPSRDKVASGILARPPQKLVLPRSFSNDPQIPVPKNSPEAEEAKEEPKFKRDISKDQVPVIPEEDANEQEESQNLSDEQKKIMAKSILKKNIAKAKLTERKLSQQSSVESEASNISTPDPCSTEPATPTPSYYKVPKPFIPKQSSRVESRAEVLITPTETLKSSQGSMESNTEEFSPRNSKESVHSQKGTHWERRIEETLKKISPEEVAMPPKKNVENKYMGAPPPIARSYRKFTFTKDGACITETRKVYRAPGTGGAWTKVEKKTTIMRSSNPGDKDDPILRRSDSQSSSGSNDIFDDIFDSWTGDSVMCNIMKMKSMFNKLHKDPFTRKPKKRDPFGTMFPGAMGGKICERGSDGSDNEEEFPFHLNDSMPVMYGSEGLSKLMQSVSRDVPDRLASLIRGPSNVFRSGSRESYQRMEGHESRVSSRTHHAYGSGVRSLSRDRPKEQYFRVRLESPLSGKTGHRDSGVESWDESDYSTAKTRYTLQEEQRRSSEVESPRHRVEQWLHMSDVDEPQSSVYGTMRPTNRYSHRSQSDRLPEKSGSGASFRTEMCVDQDGKVRQSTYSSSSSSTTTSHHRTATRSFSGNLEESAAMARPVLQMTVSFKGDAPPVVITSGNAPRMTIHRE